MTYGEKLQELAEIGAQFQESGNWNHVLVRGDLPKPVLEVREHCGNPRPSRFGFRRTVIRAHGVTASLNFDHDGKLVLGSGENPKRFAWIDYIQGSCEVVDYELWF